MAQNSPKFSKKIFLFGLSVFIAFGVGTWGIIALQSHQTLQETKDCAVVFGAAVWKNNIPSHALYDRTTSAIKLLNQEQVSCLVFSGGPSRYGAHEVEVMQKLFEDKLVSKNQAQKPPEIFLDYNGTNTLATIKNLPPNRSFVFVSNGFHLARIRLLAWRTGKKDSAFHRAEQYRGNYTREKFFVAREMLAWWYYLVFPLPEGREKSLNSP